MAVEVKKDKVRPGAAVKTTQVCREAGQLMKKFSAEAAANLASGNPVAWVMVASMAEELLAAMDISPVFTENYATTSAAFSGGVQMLETSEGEGYPQGICSYARVGIGHAILRERNGCVDPNWPLGGMQDPTVVIGSSATCEPRYKWYQQLRRYQKNVPYFCAELSMLKLQNGVDPDEAEPIVVKTASQEVRRAKDFLIKHTGQEFDEDRFMETILQMERTKDAWWKCEEIRRAVPGPMPFEDMIGAFPIGFMYCCYPESEDFFQKMYAELLERVEKKLEVGNGEKYRLLWGWGIPPYSYLKIFNIMEEYGAVPVMGTSNTCYCQYTYDDFDRFTDPFERLVTGRFRNTNHAAREANKLNVTGDVMDVLNFSRDYKCDGIVLNGTPSCRARTIGQMAAIEMLKEHSDVPILIMENDMADPRAVNEAEIRSNIESFIQVVDTAKRKRDG